MLEAAPVETDPEDVWMVLKTSWTPQPRWLSAEGLGLESPPVPAPKVRAPAKNQRQQEPACIAATGGELPALSMEGDLCPPKVKRKPPRALPSRSSERFERDRSIKVARENTYHESAVSRCRPVAEMASTPDSRNKQRKVPKSNVVELWPRRRDEMYATEILNALCAACEAHAAGEDDLLMVRIRSLYHMFDEIVR
jgi:hypothetical protein